MLPVSPSHSRAPAPCPHCPMAGPSLTVRLTLARSRGQWVMSSSVLVTPICTQRHGSSSSLPSRGTPDGSRRLLSLLRPDQRRCTIVAGLMGASVLGTGILSHPELGFPSKVRFRFATSTSGICQQPVTSRAVLVSHWWAARGRANSGAGGCCWCPGSGLSAQRRSAMGPGSAVGLLLLCGLGGGARVLHSLRYLSIAVSDPSPGVPRFQIMGYVDGNLFVHYNSDSKRYQPRAQWIEDNVGQEYWDEETQIAQRNEQIAYDDLNILWDRYNQSEVAQTRQQMYGCDLLDDGSTKAYNQMAYDGKDFITFDMDNMTFIAADAAAEITKRKWEQDGSVAEHWKNCLENICVEWLKKYVSYGQLELERRVSPTVRVSGKEQEDGILTLTCRAHGFYPRPIVLSWLKDGEVRDQDTQWGGLAPNSDGTYYTWASIEAHPGDKDRFRCRVEHASLLQPGLYALEPHSDLLSILLPVAAVVLVAITIIGVLLWKLRAGKNRDGNSATPGMAMGSASSAPELPT